MSEQTAEQVDSDRWFERPDGTRIPRPLWDTGWGPDQAARYAARRRSYVTASPLRLDDRGRAQCRLDFARADGKGVARADAARELADAYGVEVRSVYRIHRTREGGERPVREDLVVTVHGAAANVARFVAGLPRVIDYAERLTTQVVRDYGGWIRKHHTEWWDASERRARARQFRTEAFRTVVAVLVGPEDAVLPQVTPGVPPWQQVQALAGGLAQYGYVDVEEAYDPAEVRQLLAAAHQFGAVDAAHAAEEAALLDQQLRRTEALSDALNAPADDPFAPIAEDTTVERSYDEIVSAPTAPAERWPVAAAHGEQLLLPFDVPAEEGPRAAAGPVVVIPCSGAKRSHAAEAGDLYTGSLHRLARRTADALTARGGTVLALSARHGFLPLDQVIEPYDQRWTDPGSVSVDQLRAQAAQLGLAGARDVVLLTPGEYTARAATVWPHAHTPLAHLGIGAQRGRLAALRRAEHYTTAA